jgi:hypothetical protein
VALDIKEHEKLLRGKVKVEKEKLSACLYKYSCHESILCKATCSFYLIECAIGSVREADFIKAINRHIIVYALREDEYQTRTEYDVIDIYNKAKDRFTKTELTGEMGELILFVLLESERNAPQIINKMSLKTDGNMPIHGLDAIHLGVWNNELQLFYGSSKMYIKLNDAIRNSIKDIDEFDSNLKDERIELNLICNYIDTSKFKEYLDELKGFLDPYAKDKKVRKVYAVFVGFNWNSLDKSIDFKKRYENIKAVLEESMKSHEKKIVEKCEKSVLNSSIDDSFEFFFIPFKNVDEIRRHFREQLNFPKVE